MQKILIVDDQKDICITLKDTLDEKKYNFIEAEDGREALELFKKENPDLILLDILMPEMDGVKAFHKIRKVNPKSKIIIVTVLDKNEVEPKLGDLKPDGYITKPFDINKLREEVKNVLNAA